MIYKPYTYQEHATRHIIEHPGCGLFLDMGLGKTVATLSAIDELMYDHCEISKVLVIAPKRVAEDTWISESSKWNHLRHLRLSMVLGAEKNRKEALRAKADVYVINRENVAWLVGFYGTAFPFDMVVIDESSSFKNPKAARFKALRQIRPKIQRVVCLTGTPAPNSMLDLWSQLYLLDMGERLGKTLTGYRQEFFKPGRRNGFVVFDYDLQNGGQDKDILGEDIYQRLIFDRIGDICISMKTEDYLDLPERINRTVDVRVSARTMDQYIRFEREQVLALEDVEHITAVNAAGLTNKLLQFANGAVYDSEGDWHEVHRDKLEALEEIIESANGQPVLVFYTYKHDQERIKKHLRGYKPIDLKNSGDIASWNRGEVPVMLAHPASAGHGLNLQAGGNIIVWFGLPWSLELYQQANARLHRQGQVNVVIVHHLVAKGTMDEDVILSLGSKASNQDALMHAVKARILKYTSTIKSVRHLAEHVL